MMLVIWVTLIFQVTIQTTSHKEIRVMGVNDAQVTENTTSN